MSYYSTKEKSKIVQFYFETKSVVLTQRRFRAHFKVKTAPSRNTILSLTEKIYQSRKCQQPPEVVFRKKEVDQNVRKDPNNPHAREE